MNTKRTSYGRTCSLPCTRMLLSAIAVLALTSGCAVPLRLGGTVPEAVPAITTSALTLHAPATTAAPVHFPSRDVVDQWFTDVASVKAKDAEPVANGAGSPGTAAPTTPVTHECPKEGERVLLIGDSLSAGLGPHVAKRARACGTELFVHGVVGSHVTQWTQPSWLAAQLHRAKPTVVMVSLGGNDFVRNDPQNVERAIETFVETVRHSGARLLWISPPTMPFPDKIGTRGMWQTTIDGEMNVDWYPTEQLEIPRIADRVHPTIAEYSKLSVTLWQWMSTVTQ